MALSILLVDDNPDILCNIREFLLMRGFTVETAATGCECMRRLSKNSYGLCVLDVGLPDIDGMTVCRELRRAGDKIPILMLTARDAIDDRVEGLEAGADDYLVKPFSLRELAARIEALMRRAYGAEADTLKVADLVFHVGAMRVERAGVPLKLNNIGYSILQELMLKSPAIVSRARLEAVVWASSPPDSDSLRSNLYLVRQAVDKPFEKKLIKTHPGIGWSIGE